MKEDAEPTDLSGPAGVSPTSDVSAGKSKAESSRQTQLIQNRQSQILCCAIVFLAPLLGGSTTRWAEGVILVLISLLLAIDPPRLRAPRALAWVTAILLALSVTAFLPAGWFGHPAWRDKMTALGIPISSLSSPQPWLSAECIVLLVAGLAWFWWFSSRAWELGGKRFLMEVFVTGAAIIAAVAIVSFYTGYKIPIWHSERGFGPFPNRNQTGNFFAISAIIAMACMYENFRERKMRAFWYVLVSTLLCVALVLSFSRAAVILFFAGAFLWVIGLGFISRSPKGPAVCASLVVVAASVFLLSGGATLQRLQGPEAVTLGFREAIYRDALTLIHASPWNGVGPGNFEGVFALFRNASAMSSRILHPESDWLWLAAELGWIAVAVVFVAFVFCLRRVFPLKRVTERRLRLAAGCAALVFAIHGCVDVPGHRLGSMLPGLFFLALAMNNPAPSSTNKYTALFARLIALILCAAGATWIYAEASHALLPGAVGVETARARAESFSAQRKYNASVEVIAPAIHWAPLDWSLYYTRAVAELGDGNQSGARDDFFRVNLLESTLPVVTFEQGRIWLSSHPPYAYLPWRETLRRAPRPDAEQYYSQMLAMVPDPLMRPMLHSLARDRADLQVLFLAQSTGAELEEGIAGILKIDPTLHTLDDSQKIVFFHLWARSDSAAFMQRLAATPSWMRLGWREAAVYHVSKGDVRAGCELALQYMVKPSLPPAQKSRSAAELRRRFLDRPHDFIAGYNLSAAIVEKDPAAALDIIRLFTSQPECPPYFHYVEATYAFRANDFTGSWRALLKFDHTLAQ